MLPVAYETQSTDTSRETEELMFAAYRRMSAAEKLERVGRLGAMVKSVVLADLRARHPDAEERELLLRYAARMHDRETMLAAFGWAPEDGGSTGSC